MSTQLTWGQVLELMKDADPLLPVTLHTSKDPDILHIARGVFVSEVREEGGTVCFTTVPPHEG